MKRLFVAYDPNGGYVCRVWGTTEANARRWHAQHLPHCQLIGYGGRVIADAWP